MIKRYQHIVGFALRVADVVVVVVAWLAAYWARFYWIPIEAPPVLPPFGWYASAVPFIVILWAVVFTLLGVYDSGRMRGRRHEVFLIWKAHAVAMLLFIALAFVYNQYSRLGMAYFALFSAFLLAAFRVVLRTGLRWARLRGYNLRYVLVVGEGPAARAVAERLAWYPELGFRVRGVVTKDGHLPSNFIDMPVLGTYADLPTLVANTGVDEVLLALPNSQQHELRGLLAMLQDEVVDIRVVPDVFDYVTFGCHVEDFDGVPIVRLNDSPMFGARALLKRAMDVLFSSVGLVVLTPLLCLLAIAVKVTSPGPVFYSQERMGLDGHTFRMWKFRTMRVDAEAQGGAMWTRPNDDRRTPIGAFLRATSLDELPQLLNVLMGDMSLVGPRPERPVFVDRFRHEISHYMLRHKVKSGITGWAQVNGWRGDTSLQRRIECDLYYIQNWSLALDLKILTMTIWKGFINKNAY